MGSCLFKRLEYAINIYNFHWNWNPVPPFKFMHWYQRRDFKQYRWIYIVLLNDVKSNEQTSKYWEWWRR